MERSDLLAQLRARPPGQRVIVALDLPGATPALALARSLGSAASMVKVGLELFTAAGPEIVYGLRALGRDVFLDLKLLDIPQTIAGAARAAAGLGARMLTVHASAGRRGLTAAAEAVAAAAPAGGPRPAVLAVTVLTSFTAAELEEVAPSPETLPERVLRLASLAWECGADGLVCAPTDLPRLRAALGPEPLAVVPGIRPAPVPGGQPAGDDQRRTASAAAALAAGADYLVIGRPITGAPDPAAALSALSKELTDR